MRRLLILALVVFATLYAWQKHKVQQRDKRHQAVSLAAYAFGAVPQQQATQQAAFTFGDYKIQPLATFWLKARILSRENYWADEGAKLSPLDLALGWQRMADPTVYEKLNISQGSRWYHYSWRDQPPIPLPEIIESSANMHMIPADAEVKRQLEQAKAGKMIKLKGLLVEVTHPKGWRWRSSLSRSDSGDGSCEVIFVEAAEIVD